jgi:ATP-binding protein involved in chromosome partitioning
MTDKDEKMSSATKQKGEPKKFIRTPIKGTKYTIMVSSAKGGVGKSTFAVNLAFALKNLGKKVGILDADIFGPSLPKLIGKNIKPETENDKAIVPVDGYGIQCMSMGFLVGETTPMIWRGPMVISAIKTLTEKVLWKGLDYIIVDMPPGTGDTQLTFAQDIMVDGAIIISTPQDIALLDVRRGIQMFEKTKINIIGLVENMSFFKSDDGKEYNIFGKGGVEKTAKEFNKEFLGKIPLHQDLRISSDLGKPLTFAKPEHEISLIFLDIAKKLVQT